MEDATVDQNRFTLDYPDAELVFGVVCAVGTDYRPVVDRLINLLKRAKYAPEEFHVSSLFPEIAAKLGLELAFPDEPPYAHIDSRMRAGNAIRKRTEDCRFLALDIASRIYSTREGVDTDDPEAIPHAAHIIVSLKRKEEVDALRKIYGPGFFLIGIFASEEERRDYLNTEKGIDEPQLSELMSRDQQESDDDFGQRTRATFEHADVFVALKDDQYKEGIQRFLNLVFGYPYATPQKNEYGMFFAYSASARSGALGRQVGAAIFSPDGDLLAVGCNDVPSPGGGLYWDEAGKRDFREHKQGVDTNDKQKQKIVDLAVESFQNLAPKDNPPTSQTVSDVKKAVANAVGDITEFGRSVHAEMDAITTCARNGIAIRGATLFTTTYPCHNCTRHIVAAGISRVVYIEPYPKSKAGELHADAICFADNETEKKIPFVPFVGIGPRRFFDLFSLNLSTGYPIERKVDGEVINWRLETHAKPRVPMAPTSYIQREELVSKRIVATYRRNESERGTATTGDKEGRGVLAINAEDGLPSRKMASVETGREVGADKRTGTSDESKGTLFR
jgi:deoxycytidylate deaminase